MVASDISISNVTFNNGGAGSASGITYNGSTARTISYNTIGAAASSHTHSTYVNQTLTSGNGMENWPQTNGDLTITLGKPSTITGITENEATATSHTHAISLTPANIGASPLSHTHVIYNPEHTLATSNNFNDLLEVQNDIWVCQYAMMNGPQGRLGGITSLNIAGYTKAILHQLGINGYIVQTLYIVDVIMDQGVYLKKGDIYTRVGTAGWQRLAQVEEMQSSISLLTTAINGRELKMYETVQIALPSQWCYLGPSDNKTINVTFSGSGTFYIDIDFYLSELSESVIILNNPGLYNIIFRKHPSYKVAGVQPSLNNKSWIITIWKGILFFNTLN